jgi:LysM repeat protein
MEMELGSIRPDLVVLDISGNEYFAGGLNTATFADRLREVIARVKSGAPDAAILVTCSQDINRYRTTPHKDCGPAATLARMVAYETGCGFYDYHKVSGGCNSMNKWFAHGLAKLDRVHLSNEGYYLKGELFSNALLTTYHQFLIGQHVSPFQAAFLPEPQFGKVAPVQNYNVVNYSTAVASSGAVTNHTVRSGEVLGTIANRYGVAVDDIRRWNGIRGDLIRVGQVLKIYGTSPTAPAASAKTGNAPPAPKPTPAPTTRPAAHTVQSGESLWVISRKYDMTVDELLRLNALGRNDKIHPGQKLKLK